MIFRGTEIGPLLHNQAPPPYRFHEPMHGFGIPARPRRCSEAAAGPLQVLGILVETTNWQVLIALATSYSIPKLQEKQLRTLDVEP